MQDQLNQFVNEIKLAKGLNAYDEPATKQMLIIRVLNHLGWNMFDVNDIRPEYPVDTGKGNSEKVDYALAQNSDNMVFVEAKGVNKDLSLWEDQICSYCGKYAVELGVLTNGLSWWFYLPREKGSWYERKFYSIDLIQQDTNTIVSKFIDFLSKENVLSGKAIENAKRTYESKQKNQIIQKTLPKAWNILISSEDETFIELFNNIIEKISGYRAEPEKIAEFLQINKEKLWLYEDDPEVSTRRTKAILGVNAEGLEANVSNYVRTGYTGKSPTGFIFNNKKFEIRSWKQLLITLCEELSNLHSKDFNRVLSLEGRKRPYFAINNSELRRPEKIKGTNVFVETNLPANMIVKLCEDTISLFGYKNGLKVEHE